MSTLHTQTDPTQTITPTGMIRIDHIGIVVQDMEAALQTYRDALGFRLLQRITISEQLVEAARNLDCCANKPDGEVAAMWAAFDAAVARFDRKPAQETKR